MQDKCNYCNKCTNMICINVNYISRLAKRPPSPPIKSRGICRPSLTQEPCTSTPWASRADTLMLNSPGLVASYIPL